MGGVETIISIAVANVHALVKKRRVRNSNAPLLTPEIKRLMWERDRIKRIAIVTSDQLKRAEYRRLRNRVTILLRPPKRITFIRSSRITLGKLKRLTHIFNLVISKGIIPKDWKSARVTPIFKADFQSSLLSLSEKKIAMVA